MKVFSNIPGAIKLIDCLKYLKSYKIGIEEAKAEGDAAKEREFILKATSTWGPMVLERFGSKLNIQGMENLPDEGPVVFVGNHQGYADIFAYCAAFQKFQFGFVAKDNLSKIPLYGEWIRRIGSVFIERDDARASLQAIKEGIKKIESGYSLVIFPEGTRSKGKAPGEFKKGSLKLATKPGVPIIPVTINGSYRMFEEKGYLKGTDIDMIVHPLIETKGMSRQDEKELTEKVEEIITGGLHKLQES